MPYRFLQTKRAPLAVPLQARLSMSFTTVARQRRFTPSTLLGTDVEDFDRA